MSKTILVVDDDAGWRTLLGIVLKKNDFVGVFAKNSQEALQILESQTPDLMMTDFTMPGMNGIDLCVTVRQRGLTFPIVMLSGRYDAEHIARATEAGANLVLQVPIPPPQLIPKLKELLEKAPDEPPKTAEDGKDEAPPP